MSNFNLNRPANAYAQQLVALLPTVFETERKFGRSFSELQVLDGVAENKTAFTVKTNDQAIVVNNYDKTAIVDAKDSNNRFGKLQEIIYTNEDVKYDVPLSTNVLLDAVTVNTRLELAVAENLIRTASEYTTQMNIADGKFFSDVAQISETLADLTDASTEALLNKLSAAYIDLEVSVDVTMYCKPELYGALVDSRLATSGKNSSVSIDANGLYWFKGFRIEAVPSKYFEGTDVAYLVPDGVAVPFVGISLARTIEDSKYAGLILQTLSQGGRFVLDDNKKAIGKVTLTETP